MGKRGRGRANYQRGFVPKVQEGASEKTQIAVPEQFFRTDGEIGVEKNLQISARRPNA